MHIARVLLVCFVAFVFVVGCGSSGKQVEMSETATGTAMEATETKSDTAAAPAMEETAIEEVTLNVTGMT